MHLLLLLLLIHSALLLLLLMMMMMMCVDSHVHAEGEARREARNKWYNLAMMSKYVVNKYMS